MILDTFSALGINLDTTAGCAEMNESSPPSKKQEYYIHFNLLFLKADPIDADTAAVRSLFGLTCVRTCERLSSH